MSDNIIEKEKSYNLADLIEKGGVFHNLYGTNPRDLLTGLINLLPSLNSLASIDILQEILDREALVSTGIGRGIAIPHPRNPLLSLSEEPLVVMAFPEKPLDWNTPDGSKVDTVFLILSISSKQHLSALSKINFLCRQENFLSLLKKQASKEEIVTAIREAETAWANVT